MVSELRPQLECQTKALVFMGSKGNGKNDFVGPGFAWYGLSILSVLRLQATCANGVGTSLAPRVPDKRTVFLWVPKVTGSILSGCVLLGMGSCCCSGVSEPASKRLAPMVSELRPQIGCRTKALVFIGSKKVRGSILWGRVLLGMG